MSMHMNPQCYLCLLHRFADLANKHLDEAAATAYLQDFMEFLSASPTNVSAPWFIPDAYRLLRKYCDLAADPFAQEKQDSNRFVMARLDQIRAAVLSAEDPLYAGLQYAILGNYIDFSALRGEVSFDTLDGMLEKAKQIRLDEATFRQFCEELKAGKRLLYITDNAGEIGFDRIFAEVIQSHYPHLTITFCVKGMPAQNDATREDAAAVALPFPVVDNGNAIPATQLDRLSADAAQAIQAADVIIAKGQGNVETLLGCGLNIYYAFLVKCPRFIELFQKEKFTPMFLRERAEKIAPLS